jgi:Glycosyl hydrolases family 28
MIRRQFLQGSMGVAAMAQAPGSTPHSPVAYNVRSFGAVGDGEHLDTAGIQAAIDACAKGGGGAVLFPAGRHLSGTIFLKSRVTLHLDAGAVLLGSRKLEHYPVTVPAFRSYTDNYTDKSLIYAENVEDIAIEGRGVIDGQGAAFQGPYKVRPYMIRIIQCRNVSVTGVTMKDSPMWVQHYLACDGVAIRGITVHSRVNHNNDGIDIDCCERVRISDCDISSGDDAIVLKSTADRPCKDVAVTNCVLSTACNAFKLGTETNGGFENIVFSNSTIYDTRLAGIAIECVDGGVLDKLNVSNITMRNVGGPIFIRLGNRARPFVEGGPRPAIGLLRNVQISDVQITGGGPVGCAISGIPEHLIENVTVSNVRISFAGGSEKEDPGKEVPEVPEKYPEYAMFGKLPAYGLYCRHARNVSFRNIEVSFDKPEARTAMICDDVEGLELAGADLAVLPDAACAVRFHNVRDAFVQGCRARNGTNTWLSVAGSQSARIKLAANDLSRAKKAVEVVAGAPPAVVSGVEG